jgi:hypothetical protein
MLDGALPRLLNLLLIGADNAICVVFNTSAMLRGSAA